MSRLFILGSGFSKALSQEMPTIGSLSKYISTQLAEYPRLVQLYSGLSQDPERLLTYLYQPMPWKTSEEYHRDKAAFIMLAHKVAEYIVECEERAFQRGLPIWGGQFIQYLHKERSMVVTLNYDTMLERLFTGFQRAENPAVDVGASLYPVPLTHLAQRTTAVDNGHRFTTFRLLKLHGSINWYFSGDDHLQGPPVYYIPVTTDSPWKDAEQMGSLLETNRMDLVPLIIPPVAEKSFFYRTHLVRSMWSLFRHALEEAQEIYCVGYSIPSSDLTMEIFLSLCTLGGEKTIYPVNSSSGEKGEALKEEYQRIFKECTVDDRYMGSEDAVESMVVDIVDS